MRRSMGRAYRAVISIQKAWPKWNFTQLQGIGVAYDLTRNYDGDNDEVSENDH